MSRAVYRLLAGAGADKLFWRLDARRLRILCYHGVCLDTVKGTNWVPDCFVTVSAFESQMQYLSANARVLPLIEAVAQLRDGTLPSGSVCITFDDGYANNLQLAYPVLTRYGLPATIFLSSAYVESGDFFPFVKLKLIQLSLGAEAARQALLDYKSAPLDLVLERANHWWDKIETELTESQRETLRPLTIEEVSAFDAELVDLGGHSHTHCIFGNESESRRRQEILTCIPAIARWTGRPVRLFAYPNGQPGDFGPSDKEILRAQGIGAAVTGIAGANGPGADPLALRRYPVGMYHDQDGFRAELSGIRAAILRMT
jgi:peptidoglycan/xylan/chitin deacetylase (PgdA/CDA1 family)